MNVGKWTNLGSTDTFGLFCKHRRKWMSNRQEHFAAGPQDFVGVRNGHRGNSPNSECRVNIGKGWRGLVGSNL